MTERLVRLSRGCQCLIGASKKFYFFLYPFPYFPAALSWAVTYISLVFCYLAPRSLSCGLPSTYQDGYALERVATLWRLSGWFENQLSRVPPFIVPMVFPALISSLSAWPLSFPTGIECAAAEGYSGTMYLRIPISLFPGAASKSPISFNWASLVRTGGFYWTV